MAKSPAFLFYPNDWIGGTMYMTFEQKGAYMELLLLQFNTGKFTEDQAKKVLRGNEKIWAEIKGKFSEKNGLFFNKRLFLEIEKRHKHSEKQRDNIKKRWNKVGNDLVLPLENENINEKENIDYFEKSEKLLAPAMTKIFKAAYPEFPDDLKTDAPHCLGIAQKIAKSKGWTMESVTNGKLNDTLIAWQKIVEFSRTDDWFSTRALSDFNKEYQRLIQKMTNGNKVNRGNTSSSNTRITKSAGAEKLAGLLKDEIRDDLRGTQGS